MHRLSIWLIAICSLAATLPAPAATGRVIKVLPQYLDLKGQASLYPSLYERDSYQSVLRLNPERRSGLRFAIQWKATGGVWEPLKLRVEIRGIAQGNLPKELALEKYVEKTHWFGRWSRLTVDGRQYKDFGEVTAWRVTLWEGDHLLGEQKSFLW
jgi:hypothetical protein